MIMDKDKNILLIDIDEDIKTFLIEKLNLKVEENNTVINVPVLYADAEKWDKIKNNKPIYDNKNKLMLPLLLFKRNNDISINDSFPKLNILAHDTDNMFLLHSNKYSKFSTYTQRRIFNTSTERKTLQYLRLPTHITLTYSLSLFTRYIIQANEIIEQFISINNTAYGRKYRHTIKTQSISSETQIEIDKDRIIRTDIILEIKSIILSKEYDNKPNIITKPNITKISVSFNEYDNLKSLSNTNKIEHDNYYSLLNNDNLNLLDEDGTR